jgi:uncharacterized membrane protein YkvA (DUF1232 family)
MKDVPALRDQRYYDKIRKKLSGYTGKHSELILLAPDLFMLLARLMTDSRVPLKCKGYLSAAIAYFISPLDLMPEIILGPIGFLDDIVVAVLVLHKVINESSEEAVVENWSGELNILTLIQNVLNMANTLVGKRMDALKQKIGL